MASGTKKTTNSNWSAKKMASRACRLAAAVAASSSSSSSSSAGGGRTGVVSVASAFSTNAGRSSHRRPAAAAAFVVPDRRLGSNGGESVAGRIAATRSSWTKAAAPPTDRSSRLHMSSTEVGSGGPAAASDMAEDATTVAVVPPLPQSISSSSSSSPSPRRVKTSSAAVSDEVVSIKGWVRTVRKQKTLAFVEVNDGSSMGGIQCVLNFDVVDGDTMMGEFESSSCSECCVVVPPPRYTYSTFETSPHFLPLFSLRYDPPPSPQLNSQNSETEIDKLTTGSSVHAIGTIVKSQGGKQSYELSASSLRIVGQCPGDTYPLAKKRHSLEYLRTIAHLRPRTNTIAAVSRVRSVLAGAIHSHFQSSGFRYVQTPLITASDCEGAGEMFRVTTLNVDDVASLPRAKDPDTGLVLPGVDHARDFFGKAAFLTVSGQLGGEAYACALGDVYTFGPTFRAENSQTARHLAEFWMVEPEMAFADLASAMDGAEGMLKDVVGKVLEECDEDLTFFSDFFDKGLRGRLEKLVSTPFVRLPYRDAIVHLQEEIAKDPSMWQFPEVEFGTDLATEHERWLAEKKFESAVFVYNYPKKIKAFYMRDNDDDGGETVNAMDLLVPGVGELVGGSQRVSRSPVWNIDCRGGSSLMCICHIGLCAAP